MDVSVKRRRRHIRLLNAALANRDALRELSSDVIGGLSEMKRLRLVAKTLEYVPLPTRKHIDVASRNAREHHNETRELEAKSNRTLNRVIERRRRYPIGLKRRILSGFHSNFRLERRRISRFLRNKRRK